MNKLTSVALTALLLAALHAADAPASTAGGKPKFVIEEWPGPMEIPLALPIVVLAGCLVVLTKGPGAWSADLRAS